jgi:hypothetical protein
VRPGEPDGLHDRDALTGLQGGGDRGDDAVLVDPGVHPAAVDPVTDRGRHRDARPAGAGRQRAAVADPGGGERLERVLQVPRHPRVVVVHLRRRHRPRDQLGADDDVGRAVQRADLVADGAHRPLRQGDQPPGGHLHRRAARRRPAHPTVERAGAQVQRALVDRRQDLPHVEDDAVDQQAQRRAVGDGQQRLPLARVPVAALGVGQRVRLVHPGQVGAAHAERLDLVERPRGMPE